jgi:DNA polymerase-3 subunit gamma/tau
MVAAVLNLARKWRSKQFNQVVGQDLPVRMLQNSLYIGQIFPVYLFSGQRGCGKTTTARIFASALNCYNLDNFKKDPKQHKIPCLSCVSCVAMATGNHPDFIEIDAASHTGVDNVRQIIDAASLLPVMGTKRVYLIDEAHMLSKAAFNAFLKILEEPPASVVFMLATTDPEKILETVRSRCFQLFFTPIGAQPLIAHLQEVCKVEAIDAELAALEVIVQETEGSARDALNLLEQVRFSSAAVTHDVVLSVLGHMPESLLLNFFDAIAQKDVQACLAFLDTIHEGRYTPLLIWQKLQELVRSVLALKNNVKPCARYNNKDRVLQFAQGQKVSTLVLYLQILYDYELVLLKSTAQEGLLSLMILTMMGQNDQQVIQVQTPAMVVPERGQKQESVRESVTSTAQVMQEQPRDVIVHVAPRVEQVSDDRWMLFADKVETLSDPLLKSIFKQGHFKSYEQETGVITVVFPIATKFYGEWLQETKLIWQPLLQEVFGSNVAWTPLFEDGFAPVQVQKSSNEQQISSTPTSVKKDEVVGPEQRYTNAYTQKKVVQGAGKAREKMVDVSDKETWKTANMLLDTFGGTVVEVEEKNKQESL